MTSMKKLALVLLLFFSLLSTLQAEGKLVDRVAAVVNDEVITQSELDMVLGPLYQQYKQEYQGEELDRFMMGARQKLLSQMIEDRLVFQEAKRRNLEPDDVDIENDLAEFKKKFKTEAELDNTLKNEGLTLASLRERLERQTMIRQLQDMEVRSKVVVSPLEVEEYYHDHPEEFSSRERIKVRSMTIKKNSEARKKGMMDEGARRKIESLQKDLLSGSDFGALAKEHSEDTSAKNEGLAGWIERGVMIPAIEGVIFKMKLAQLSEVIETDMGYHLFRVEEREAGKRQPFEKAREEIFGKLFRKKAEQRFREWLLELKRNAYISIR